MVVFRITAAKWAGVLTGSGHPGRWNSRGHFVLYAATSRALACLENLVHLSGEREQIKFKLTEIEIPDVCTKQIILPGSLPPLWHRPEHYHLCQPEGDKWIESLNSLMLIVPSSIIEDEHNIIINQTHPQFPLVSVRKIKDFTFDERL